MSYTAIPLIGSRRIRTVVFMLIAAVLLVVGPAPVTPAAAKPSPYRSQNGTIVRCDPATASGVIDEDDVVVDMYVENVVGLYGVDLRVSFFDTTIVQVVDQSSASGVQNQPLSDFLQPDYIARNTADNTNGTIRYAATQTSPNPPVDGSGPVARITFHGLEVGVFTMTWGDLELSDIDGRFIPATGQPCEIRILSPLAVTLSDFQASSRDDHVLVSWETVSEVENQGFNLLRSMSNSGDRARLNDLLMPSQDPGSGQGAEYEWLDHEVVDGETYFYWLESVDFDGSTELSGPVTVTYESPTAVELSALITDVNASPSVPLLVLVLGLVVVLFTGLVAAESRRRPT